MNAITPIAPPPPLRRGRRRRPSRAHVERVVAFLIDYLDRLDSDPDLEESDDVMAFAQGAGPGDPEDAEVDDEDLGADDYPCDGINSPDMLGCSGANEDIFSPVFRDGREPPPFDPGKWRFEVVR